MAPAGMLLAGSAPVAHRTSLTVRPSRRLATMTVRAEATAPKPTAPKSAAPAEAAPTGVTVEYQRAQAKEMTKYFKRLKTAQTAKNAPVFGFTRGNEISNGRWVMFGLLVGCLTEYATGVDFIDQMKLMGAVFGIVDTD